jgi:AraC-like DNA-binding protein
MQDRVFWLQHEHFDFRENSAWLEQTAFSLKAFYDVVAAPQWRITTSVQPWSEIWLVQSGRVEITLDNHRTVVKAGELALISAGQKRDSREIDGQPLSILGFSYNATLLDTFEVPALLAFPSSITANKTISTTIREALLKGVAESRHAHAGFSLAAQGWAQIIFVEVLRLLYTDADLTQRLQDELRKTLTPEISAALDYIAHYYSGPIELRTLANHVHLSAPYFARRFKQVIGTSPMEYLRQFRIEKARQLLLSSEAAISEIAFQSGFPDAAHFSRAFKIITGLSPGDYRRQTRAFYPRKS